MSDTTFGNENTGTNYGPLENTHQAGLFTTGVAGTADSLIGYIHGGSGEAHLIKGAIYSSDKSTLIGATDEYILPRDDVDAWRTLTFSEPKPSLSASTSYFLVAWGNTVLGSIGLKAQTTLGTNNRYSNAKTYGAWYEPILLGTLTDDQTSCIYCSYTKDAGVECYNEATIRGFMTFGSVV